MKPRGCIEKKAFGYYNNALVQVCTNYKWWIRNKNPKHRAALGIYTCPICLDFHTTCKHSNLPNKARWRALERLLGVRFKRTQELLDERRLKKLPGIAHK